MLRQPTLSDLEYICLNLRQSDRDEIYNVLNHDNPFLLARQTLDIAATGFVTVAHAARPIAIVGFHELHAGVFTVMAYGTDEFPQAVKQLTRFIRKELTPALIASGAHRAQCDSRADHFSAHRWLQSLGFTAEATMRAYGRDRSDYIRFSIVRDHVLQSAKDTEAQAIAGAA